jgi:YggT family protein
LEGLHRVGGGFTSSVDEIAQPRQIHMIAVLVTLKEILNFYQWIVIAAVIVSWLVNFQIINTQNRVVYSLLEVLYKMTEPVFNVVRRVLPNMGGLDLSPIVVLFGLFFLQTLIANKLMSMVSG